MDKHNSSSLASTYGDNISEDVYVGMSEFLAEEAETGSKQANLNQRSSDADGCGPDMTDISDSLRVSLTDLQRSRASLGMEWAPSLTGEEKGRRPLKEKGGASPTPSGSNVEKAYGKMKLSSFNENIKAKVQERKEERQLKKEKGFYQSGSKNQNGKDSSLPTRRPSLEENDASDDDLKMETSTSINDGPQTRLRYSSAKSRDSCIDWKNYVIEDIDLEESNAIKWEFDQNAGKSNNMLMTKDECNRLEGDINSGKGFDCTEVEDTHQDSSDQSRQRQIKNRGKVMIGDIQSRHVPQSTQYLSRVREAFGADSPEYSAFAKTLKEFISNAIPAQEVVQRILYLFHGEDDLILGFNDFLPSAHKIKLPPDNKTVNSISTPASKYLDQVKEAFGANSPEYSAFAKTLKGFVEETIPAQEVVHRIVYLFHPNWDLILGFNDFLPPAHKIKLPPENKTDDNISTLRASMPTMPHTHTEKVIFKNSISNASMPSKPDGLKCDSSRYHRQCIRSEDMPSFDDDIDKRKVSWSDLYESNDSLIGLLRNSTGSRLRGSKSSLIGRQGNHQLGLKHHSLNDISDRRAPEGSRLISEPKTNESFDYIPKRKGSGPCPNGSNNSLIDLLRKNSMSSLRGSSLHGSRSSSIRRQGNCQQGEKIHSPNDISDRSGSQGDVSLRTVDIPMSMGHYPPLPYEENGALKSACRNYQLGETLRSPNDIIDRRSDGSLRLISELKTNDGAFIKRADGSFTYAIVKKRYVDPEDNEDTLLFMVNSARSTKAIPRRRWKSCIRVENKQHDDDGDDIDLAASTINSILYDP